MIRASSSARSAGITSENRPGIDVGSNAFGLSVGGAQRELQARLDFARRERSGPARVHADEDEALHQSRSLPVQLQRERRSPRVSQYVRPLQAEGVDEAREAIAVLRHTKVLGRVGRLAAAGCIPSDDRERIRQRVAFGTPDSAVAYGTVHEHQCRPFAAPFKGDTKTSDVDMIHVHSVGDQTRWWS